MDDTERLELLFQKHDDLERVINAHDHDIALAERALMKGEEPQRLVAYLRDEREIQQGHFLALGRLEAQIDDVKARLREQDTTVREHRAVEAWDPETREQAKPSWYEAHNNLVEPAAQESQPRSQRDWFVRGDVAPSDQDERERDRTRDR